MPFTIVRNDIVNMRTDVIVNTASPCPVIGGGTDAAIHKAAGPQLLAARKKIGGIAPGKACITPGFDLPAKYVIHTVSPVWQGGSHGEQRTLQMCYQHALELAEKYGCKSIAFPLISAGTYGFPGALALQTAMQVCSGFLMEHEMQIFLVVFSKEAYELSGKLQQSVESYIDDNYVQEQTGTEYCMRCSRRASAFPEMPEVCSAEADLDDLLKHRDAGFAETLVMLIEHSGKKNSEIYKKANVDKKLFSKIINNVNYHPSKATAVAFSIALELNLEQTRDLVSRAGYSMTHSSKFDIIIEYFILHHNYDIFEINETLFQFDQPLLGC